MKLAYDILCETIGRFINDDGWAIAGYVALSALTALFPFLIFAASLSATLGVGDAAGTVVELIFEGWPQPVAEPLVREINDVLSRRPQGVLTLSIVATVWVASNAVESLRIALDRAYDVIDRRPWWQGRLLGFAFVVIGAATLLTVAIGIVLWPSISGDIVEYIGGIETGGWLATATRYALAAVILGAALTAAHLWLPAGRRRVREVLPGVVATLVLWLVGATLFGLWLAHFANYASTYAGLASAMIALVFLNLNSSLFILGAEFNATLYFRRGRLAAWRPDRRRGVYRARRPVPQPDTRPAGLDPAGRDGERGT